VHVREGIERLIVLPGVKRRDKTRYRRTFELYVSYAPLSFADCCYVAVMAAAGLSRLIGFDHHFDRSPCTFGNP
jgi:predicted nucleic acid-binding protein